MVSKTPAKKAPAKRKPRAKKPVDHAKIAIDQLQADFAKITTEDLLRAADELRNKKLVEATTPALPWKTYAKNIAFGFAMLAAGVAGGWWSAGGIVITPVHDDVLQQSHAADRASQVRILREYASQTFPDEPAAQAWLNNQRIEARKTDWIPYTDELGAAADSGVDAVKSLADKLEGVK